LRQTLLGRSKLDGKNVSDEVELKFDVEPASAAALRAHPILAGSVARLETSESRYFDTRGRALRKAGISLRVRRSGGRIVQTVKRKRGDATGLFVRQEWEAEVRHFRLDPARFEPRARRLLARAGGDKLKPVMRTRFVRTSWQIEHQGSRIEVVLDEGEVRAGRRATPLTELELELELKRGRPAALFNLAMDLGSAAPLRLGTLSKSERGHALAEGRLGRAAKSDPIPLAPAMTEGDAFHAIPLACLRQFRLNEIALLAGRDRQALHQARVALRRLRSAMTLFRGAVRGKDYQVLRDELRWFAGEFGEARNLDVLTSDGAPPPFDRHAALRAALAPQHSRAYDRVAAALASERARMLMLRLAFWLELGGWRFKPRAEAPVRLLAATRLDRQWRRIRRHGAALGRLDPDAEHRLRIEIKKLRYAAEFLAGLFPTKVQTGRRDRFMTALRDLQERLGAANDARLANAIAARLAPDGPPLPLPTLDLKAAEKALRRATAAASFWDIAW
jgi:inorganic triphosphatase YgiF